MEKEREEAIKKFWNIAKEKNPFNDETISNGYLEGFIDLATEIIKEQQGHHKKVCEELTDTHRNLRDKIADLEDQITKWKEDCICLENLMDYQIKELQEENTKAKGLLKWFVWYFREGSPNLVPYRHKVEEAEQFLSEVGK